MMSNEDNLDSSTSSSDAPMLPREKMIETAVTFLLNPRVLQSAVSHKTCFLKKKGLTEEEIDIALKRSTSLAPNSVKHLSITPQSHYPSFWTRLQGFSSTTVIIGTSLYLLYQLYQKYIRPFIFGIPTGEDIISKLEKAITALQTSISSLESAFLSVNKKLEECCASIDTICQSEQSQNTASNIQNLKKDIGSLKGLLLSRKQFPPAPTPSPVIPSWQREQPSPDTEENDDNTTSNGNTQSVPQLEYADSKTLTTNVDGENAGAKSSETNSSDNGSYICVSDVSEGNES